MRILHVADTHLGHRRWNLPEREKDLYDVFDEVADIAIEEKVDLVLHAGDMFDKSDPPPQTYIRTYEILKKLRDKNIGFYVVAGNHEVPGTIKDSPLSFFEKIGLLKILSLRDVGREVLKDEYGRDLEIYGYSKKISRKFFEEKIPVKDRETIRIALIHELVCEPMRDYLGWTENMCRERELPMLSSSPNIEYFSYIALGDLHIRWENKIRGSIAVYPGSTEALNKGEAFDENYNFIDRYVYIIDVLDKEIRYRPRRLTKTRPWIYIEAKDHRDAIMKIQSLSNKKFVKPPILVIHILRREGSLERERLIKELNDLVDKNVIFKIDSISYAEEERPVSYNIKEGAEGFSLDKVLTEVFGDREIAELIRDFIDEKIDERTLMNRLREDKDFLDKLHKIIRETRL